MLTKLESYEEKQAHTPQCNVIFIFFRPVKWNWMIFHATPAIISLHTNVWLKNAALGFFMGLLSHFKPYGQIITQQHIRLAANLPAAGPATWIFHEITPPPPRPSTKKINNKNHRSLPNLGVVSLAVSLPPVSFSLPALSVFHTSTWEEGNRGKWRRQWERMRFRGCWWEREPRGLLERKVRKDCGERDEWQETWVRCLCVCACLPACASGGAALNVCSSGLILQDRTIKD